MEGGEVLMATGDAKQNVPKEEEHFLLLVLQSTVVVCEQFFLSMAPISVCWYGHASYIMFDFSHRKFFFIIVKVTGKYFYKYLLSVCIYL